MFYYMQLLVFLLTSSSSLFSFSYASISSHHRHLAVNPTHLGHDDDDAAAARSHGIVGRQLFANRRELVKYEPNLQLAEGRTQKRKDVFNIFKPYKGGWNISDFHYQWSVIYTGGPFYVISFAWFLVFALTWIISLIICYCSKMCKTRTCNDTFSVACLSFFTFITIAGAVVLLWSGSKFNTTGKKAVNYLSNETRSAAGNVSQVYTYLGKAGNVTLVGDQYKLTKYVRQDIKDGYSRFSLRINTTTTNDRSKNNLKTLQSSVASMWVYLIVIAAGAILLVLMGFAASSQGYIGVVYFLAIIGWLLVTAAFFHAGLAIYYYNEVGDTCLAMEEWIQQGPVEGTAMDELISCSNVKVELRQTEMATQQLVALIDDTINGVANADSSKSSHSFSSNSIRRRRHKSTNPFVPLLCNPYYDDLSPRQCEEGEVEITNATEAWKNYVCKEVGGDGRTCLTSGRLTPIFYQELSDVVTIGSHLYNFTPLLTNMDKCANVETVLQDITSQYCAKISKYTKIMAITLPILSVALMFSIIFWLDYSKKPKSKRGNKPAAAQSRPITTPPTRPPAGP